MSSTIPGGALDTLIGQVVVLDMVCQWTYVGRLHRVDAEYLVLDDADAHDLRDAPKSREKYLLDGLEHGLHPNRKRVWVSRSQVVGLARLADVLFDSSPMEGSGPRSAT